jgi:cellulose synthase/poly-beta-1,6-N-acetylglucosamine synthase-like glycosyltransferase
VQPLVSVLVPVLNEEAHLPSAVEHMLAQRFDDGAEFLFIDGGSTDRSRSILTALAAADERVRILDNPRRITPAALNVGLAAARGDVIVRMDAHTHYPPEYLRLGVERLQRGGAASVSGPQIAVGDGAWSRRVALALSTPLGVGGARFRLGGHDGEFEVDTGFTGMWLRSTLEAAGGWDEDWTTDQDCELAFRLSANGGRHVCLPAMAAEYIPRDSPRALGRQYWRYGYGKVRTWRRHPGAMRTSHVLPLGVAGATVAAIASPRPVRRAARVGLGVYGAALAAGALRARREAAPADVAVLPAVFATMHLAYGFGALWGFVRLGVPTAALAGVARRLARS